MNLSSYFSRLSVQTIAFALFITLSVFTPLSLHACLPSVPDSRSSSSSKNDPVPLIDITSSDLYQSKDYVMFLPILTNGYSSCGPSIIIVHKTLYPILIGAMLTFGLWVFSRRSISLRFFGVISTLLALFSISLYVSIDLLHADSIHDLLIVSLVLLMCYLFAAYRISKKKGPA